MFITVCKFFNITLFISCHFKGYKIMRMLLVIKACEHKVNFHSAHLMKATE